MKNKILSLLSLGAILMVVSCSYVPDEAAIVEEQLVAVTQYDPTPAIFTQYATFSASSYVAYITAYNAQTGVITYTEETGPDAQAVINAAVQNMLSRGYTKVASNGDLDLQFSAVKITNMSVYYPGWWWDYYPYYPYYPYPYTPIVSGYTVGSLIIDMIDKLHQNVNGQYPIVWTGLVRALLDGSHSTADVTKAINECFTQTPNFHK